MNRISLFEGWENPEDKKNRANPLADAILGKLSKWDCRFIDVTSPRRKGHGGVAIMVPYHEIIKFLASGYFTDAVVARMKPSHRLMVELAKQMGWVTPYQTRTRWSGEEKSGLTFVIMRSGNVRRWLDEFKKVSSNNNVNIDPTDKGDVAAGAKKFLEEVLVYNIDGIIVRLFLENQSKDDLDQLSDSILKNKDIILQLVVNRGSQISDELMQRILVLNKRNDSIIYQLVNKAGYPRKADRRLYETMFRIITTYHEDNNPILRAFCKLLEAPRELRLKALTLIENPYDIEQAFESFRDITAKELMDLYFEGPSNKLKELIKNHPNFGDIIGDEGGILDDW